MMTSLYLTAAERSALSTAMSFFRETADLALHVHMEIQGALVVSGSCGVQAGTGIADVVRQPLFDIHMDIFEFDGEVKLSLIDLFLDFLETRCDFFPDLQRR